MKEAFEFLINSDLRSMEEGKYDIDGDNIFASVQTLTTKPIKELVVAGRSFKLPNEYFDFWRNEHKNDLVVTWRMRLSIDRGNSKCYRIVAMNEEIGFIWVDGDRVRSVSWY